MTAALAFFAAASAVLGGWEVLAAVEGTAVAAVLDRAVEPVRRAGREGREPTAPERRRLQVLAAAALLGAGWLVAGPTAAVVAATGGPLLAIALVRARRRRFVAELRRGARRRHGRWPTRSARALGPRRDRGRCGRRARSRGP